MNNSLFRRFFALFCIIMSLALLFCACERKEGDTEKSTLKESATQTEAKTEAKTEPETETKLETVTETEAGPKIVTYTVKVVDANGAPVAGATIQLCQGDLCLPPMPTNENGIAVFEAYEAEYTAKVFATGYTSDSDGYTFSAGSYELTVTVNAAE